VRACVCVCMRACMCVCASMCVRASKPQSWSWRGFVLVSWCPLISWHRRRFQNGATASGISFHCHGNDSDTPAPSDSDPPLCGNRNAISLVVANGSCMTIPLKSERSPNDSPFRRGRGASSQLKREDLNSSRADSQ